MAQRDLGGQDLPKYGIRMVIPRMQIMKIRSSVFPAMPDSRPIVSIDCKYPLSGVSPGTAAFHRGCVILYRPFSPYGLLSRPRPRGLMRPQT